MVHTIQEKWVEKKLARALLIVVKGAFNHVSWSQLFKCMIELAINRDLITWTRSFLINQKIHFVIDRRKNKKREIKTGISQRSLILPILFLIYNSGVFDSVSEAYFLITSLLFVDDIRFIAS